MLKLALITFVFVVTALLFISPQTVRADCSPALAKPTLSAAKGPASGSVKLNWNQVSGASRYALVYGLTPGNYMFGALSVDGGVDTNFTVMMLQPGTAYNFQIWAFCNDSEAPSMSNETIMKAP